MTESVCSDSLCETSPPEITAQSQLVSIGIDFDKLKKMLQRETELRLSDVVQEQYRIAGYDSYVTITTIVQRQVAMEFGFGDDIRGLQLGIQVLRCAEDLVCGDEGRRREVKELSFYRKFNRSVDGDLEEGGPCVMHLEHPLHLHDSCLSPLLLSDVIRRDKPTVLLAGSYS